MEINGYKERIIDKKLKLYLEIFGAVLIEGPKWCGKTWTGRNISNSEFLISDPKGNFNNKKLALMNPELILEGETPRLIDEWQETPLIWDAVRGSVDNRNIKGQYILTGSATINKNSYIHSGTGRIARLRMRPMSLYESGKSDGRVSLKDICNGNTIDCLSREVSLDEIIDYILVGGWPSTYNLDNVQGKIVAEEYIKSVINEDLSKIDNIKRDKHKVELLLRSLARNEATTVTNNTIKNDISNNSYESVNIDTISDYLNILTNLYIIENIPPYATKTRSTLRIKQNEKRHFVDPSLPCALLSLTKSKLLEEIDFLGFLFESLVERDLLIYCDSINGKLYHYQDYNNNEIDAVIELSDGEWCAFEIKLGANKIEEAANNLVRINNEIESKGGKPAKSLCIICGLTNANYKRNDGVYVVSITSLKD